MTKGQSAIEYMTTYAWVVVVVALGALLLWQMGVFKPPAPPRGFIGFSELKPTDWAVSIDDEIRIHLESDSADTIFVPQDSVSASIDEIECAMTTPSFQIPPGGSYTILLSCPEGSMSGRFNRGDYYESNIVVVYKNLKSNSIHESVGKIYGPIEASSGHATDTTLPGGSTTTTTLCGRMDSCDVEYLTPDASSCCNYTLGTPKYNPVCACLYWIPSLGGRGCLEICTGQGAGVDYCTDGGCFCTNSFNCGYYQGVTTTTTSTTTSSSTTSSTTSTSSSSTSSTSSTIPDWFMNVTQVCPKNDTPIVFGEDPCIEAST